MPPLDAATAEYLQNAPDQQLLQLHRAVVSQVLFQVTRMGLEQRKLTNGFDREMNNRMFFRGDGSDLTATSKRSMDVITRRTGAKTQTLLRRRTDFAAANASVSYARTLAQVLEDRGYPVTTSRFESIARKVTKAHQERFGTTREALVRSVTRRHDARLKRLIAEQTGGLARDQGDRRLAAQSRIQAAGATGMYGPETKGGSILKDMGRIVATEALADVYDTSRELIASAGLGFVYRRGFGTARRCSCDALNTASYPGIGSLLHSAGIDSSGIDFRGLYPIDAAPEYPHASCKCFLEPMFI